MKNNERNAGRKKKTNEAYTVRCHPKVIKDVRKFAKERSEEYEQELKKEQK
jgi:mRNA-degrading endonuclease RelE of RelBE toxin-antitoxin system